MNSRQELLELTEEYQQLQIDTQIDYKKLYLYSLITHSTAIEGSTVTETENELLFEKGICSGKRSITEQMMNLDLKAAYELSAEYAQQKKDITVEMLKTLSSIVMKNTGSTYSTAVGSFSAAQGDLRLLNVSAGSTGKSYLHYAKIPQKLEEFCRYISQKKKKLEKKDICSWYEASFEAHYTLVMIHPWADGNGRMSRLLMNQIQRENDLLPVIVKKERRSEYIESLKQSSEAEEKTLFIEFMFREHCINLKEQIVNYKKATASDILF